MVTYLRDWDRLSVVNEKSLVVGIASDADFRPLPTEAEIAEVVTEIAKRNQRIEALKAESDRLSKGGPAAAAMIRSILNRGKFDAQPDTRSGA